jgi:hypothetical protein
MSVQKAAEESRVRPAPNPIEAFGAFARAGRHHPAWRRSNQRPPLSQRSRSYHPGSAARRISIHSGVMPGKVASSSRACAFVWVTQGITMGASPSSGWPRWRQSLSQDHGGAEGGRGCSSGAEHALSVRCDPPFLGTLAGCFLTRPELLRPSIARWRWIIWRRWWIERRCLYAVQLLLV